MRTLRKITTGLVMAFFISEMLPDNWRDLIHVAGVPLSAFFLAFLCCTLSVYMLVRPAVVTPWLAAGLFVLGVMSVIGVLRGNVELYTLKFVIADCFYFLAFLCGYALPRALGGTDTAMLVSKIAIIAGVAIILNYVALYLGLVSSNFEIGGRTVTGSIFDAVSPLMILLPWAAVSTDALQTNKNWKAGWLFLVTVLTGLVSATRSILLGAVFLAFLYIVLRWRYLGTIFMLRVVTGFVLLLVMYFAGLLNFGAFAFQRLNETQINEESRWAELALWWPQVKDDIAFGQGMGSRYVSNVITDGSPLSSAPHVGIVTFLMKGGVVLFLVCALLPCIVAVRVLFSSSVSQEQRGAAATVLMFIGLSCLSGGWYSLSLFCYGLGIGSMTLRRKVLSARFERAGAIRIGSVADFDANRAHR
jgi:hypothetical protein